MSVDLRHADSLDVLPTLAGTGTTLQAAELEGFDSLGIERDPHAYALACQRLGIEAVA